VPFPACRADFISFLMSAERDLGMIEVFRKFKKLNGNILRKREK
jgi:hypothetical protein